jgi:Spy/CpxP family protein refolding chaperone
VETTRSRADSSDIPYWRHTQMRKTLLTAFSAAVLVLALTGSTANAQAARPRAGADAETRREWLKEHRGDARAKWESLTPEQREAFKAQMKAYQEERKSLMEQVKAGKIDKKTAAEQLKAWREAHKPAKP